MKVKFSSDIINMSAEVPDTVASELASFFFNKVAMYSNQKVEVTPTPPPPKPENRELKRLTSFADLGKSLDSVFNPEPTKKESANRTYKGFLHLKCQHCGTVIAFFAKEEISYYYCKECGKETPFDEPLKNMELSCPSCGKVFRYRTNSKEPQITHTCIECGAPVDMEYVEKKDCYMTMK